MRPGGLACSYSHGGWSWSVAWGFPLSSLAPAQRSLEHPGTGAGGQPRISFCPGGICRWRPPRCQTSYTAAEGTRRKRPGEPPPGRSWMTWSRKSRRIPCTLLHCGEQAHGPTPALRKGHGRYLLIGECQDSGRERGMENILWPVLENAICHVASSRARLRAIAEASLGWPSTAVGHEQPPGFCRRAASGELLEHFSLSKRPLHVGPQHSATSYVQLEAPRVSVPFLCCHSDTTACYPRMLRLGSSPATLQGSLFI